MKKALAFLLRDLIEAASYKLAFVMQLAGIFFSVLTFYFLSQLFGQGVSPYLKPYGGDYFAFVLIGIAFANYLGVALRSFSSQIRTAQVMGTLEAMLVTQTEIPTIILSSSLYSFIFTSFQVVIYLLLGSLLFGVNMGQANLVAALLILLLTIISFSAIGIISASFVMVFKRGDPLAWLFGSASILFGGVYYPIAILPGWLEKVAYLLTITYSLEGMRLALLKGHSLNALLPNLLALSIFTLVLLPLSIMSFQWAVRKAKLQGTLTHY